MVCHRDFYVVILGTFGAFPFTILRQLVQAKIVPIPTNRGRLSSIECYIEENLSSELHKKVSRY